MKHGDKTKGKASKASSKKAGQSGKATGKVAASSKSKTVPEKVSAKTGAKTSAKGDGRPKAGNGAGGTRPGGDGFSNPIVGAAFKHAVKKYPNAFRKLTD